VAENNVQALTEMQATKEHIVRELGQQEKADVYDLTAQIRPSHFYFEDRLAFVQEAMQELVNEGLVRRLSEPANSHPYSCYKIPHELVR